MATLSIWPVNTTACLRFFVFSPTCGLTALCSAGMIDGGTLETDATVTAIYLPLLNQWGAALNIQLYLASILVFYCARGQGRLPDRIFIDLDLEGSDAAVLCLLGGQFLAGMLAVEGGHAIDQLPLQRV